MIPVRLTTVSGETKSMSFTSNENVKTFIQRLEEQLPVGVAVNVDAPLIGIHGGWVIGKNESSGEEIQITHTNKVVGMIVLTIFFVFILYNHASYTLAKNSDF